MTRYPFGADNNEDETALELGDANCAVLGLTPTNPAEARHRRRVWGQDSQGMDLTARAI